MIYNLQCTLYSSCDVFNIQTQTHTVFKWIYYENEILFCHVIKHNDCDDALYMKITRHNTNPKSMIPVFDQSSIRIQVLFE